MAENYGNSARRGVAWTTVGSLGNYGVRFVFNIFLARLLSPEDFGICFMPVLFYTLAHICVEGGFSSALIREREVTERDFCTAFWFRQLMGVAFYGLLWMASPWIAAFYDTPVLVDVIKVSALSLVIVPLTMIPHVRFMRRLDFRTPAILGITGAVVSGLTGVVMALRGWGLWAIVWSGLMTDVFSLVFLTLVAPWLPRMQFSRASLRRMLGFGSKMQASQLLNTINDNLAPILIGKIYTGHALGLYMRARNWASIPSSGITGIVGKVIFPLFSRLQDDRERLSTAFRRVSRLSAFVVFPLMMVIVALSDPMVRVLLTDRWADCVPYNRLLCVAMMWYPIHSINLQLLIAKGHSARFLRLELIKTALFWSMMVCFRYGVMCYLLVNAVLSPLLLLLNGYYTQELSGVRPMQQVRDLLPILLFSLALSGMTWGITQLFASIYWQFVVGSVVAVVFYLVAGRRYFPRELQEVIRMVRRHRH